jgi:GNAT superfamily N-acetyltransferase
MRGSLTDPQNRHDGMKDLKLVHIARLTTAQMDRVTGIYGEAFGAPWDMPAEKLGEFAAERAEGGTRGRAVALLHDDVPVALALTSYLRESNYLYLECLVNDAACRSRGLGGKMLEVVTQAAEEMALTAGCPGCLGTLAEVETLDGPPSTADRHLRERRIAFYLRQGAVPTGVHFARPPWAQLEMPEWEIMLLPGHAWEGPLDGRTRRAMGYALMVEGYGVNANADWLVDHLDRIYRPG